MDLNIEFWTFDKFLLYQGFVIQLKIPSSAKSTLNRVFILNRVSTVVIKHTKRTFLKGADTNRGRTLFSVSKIWCGHYSRADTIRGRILIEYLRYITLDRYMQVQDGG